MTATRLQPAEWAPHEAVWIGWPSAADLWEDNLAPAQAEVAAFARAVAFPALDNPHLRGERVELVLRGEASRAAAESFRGSLPDPEMIRLHEAPMGDVWLRDTGPIFVRDEHGELAASAFRFNGWGGKYELPEDERMAAILSGAAKIPLVRFDGLVAEGGALEPDGEGAVITTRQCLLNRNRNPNLTERDVENLLRRALGAEKVIWLDEGLRGDHTDGHVDNIVRFVSPARVVCMRPTGDDDPNADIYDAIRRALDKARDAKGRTLEVIEIPSPGRILKDGEPVPASHVNFYIANHTLIAPTYEGLTGDHDAAEQALDILRRWGGRQRVVGVDSSALLSGGGSFHCISQQQPAP
jgi:agmatine deiminase